MLMKNLAAIGMMTAVLFQGTSLFAAEANKEEKAEEKVAAAAPVRLANFPPELEAPAKAMAEKMIDGLVSSLKSGDYAAFQAVQPQTGQQIKKNTFTQMRDALTKRYGTLTASEYLGRLDQGVVMDFLWKFSFVREKDGARRQIICWVRTGALKGEVVIAGFSFCFF